MSLSNDATLTMPVAPAYSAGGYGSNGSMWGGDWSAWIILFLIWGAFGGGWGNGFGGSFGGANGPGFQGYATRSDINEGFALNNLQSGINSIQNGICDSTYTLTNAINNGFHGVDTAVCNLGYQTQAGFNALGAQLAQCCCDTQRSIDGVRYDMATQACDTRNTIQTSTRDIIDNANANTRAILDKLTSQEMAAKDAQIQAQNQQIFGLQLAASQQAQNNYLVNQLKPCPVPAYITCNPWAGQTYGCCTSACGC